MLLCSDPRRPLTCWKLALVSQRGKGPQPMTSLPPEDEPREGSAGECLTYFEL